MFVCSLRSSGEGNRGVIVDSVWQSLPHTDWWKNCVTWLRSVGGCLIQSSWFERCDLNNYWLLAPPPPPFNQTSCALSVDTQLITSLSFSGSISPPPGILFSCFITVFAQFLIDLCKVDQPPENNTCGMILFLLKDSERSHRHDLDLLNFTGLAWNSLEELQQIFHI